MDTVPRCVTKGAASRSGLACRWLYYREEELRWAGSHDVYNANNQNVHDIYATKILGPIKSSAFIFSVPFLAITTSYIFLNEPLKALIIVRVFLGLLLGLNRVVFPRIIRMK